MRTSLSPEFIHFLYRPNWGVQVLNGGISLYISLSDAVWCWVFSLASGQRGDIVGPFICQAYTKNIKARVTGPVKMQKPLLRFGWFIMYVDVERRMSPNCQLHVVLGHTPKTQK